MATDAQQPQRALVSYVPLLLVTVPPWLVAAAIGLGLRLVPASWSTLDIAGWQWALLYPLALATLWLALSLVHGYERIFLAIAKPLVGTSPERGSVDQFVANLLGAGPYPPKDLLDSLSKVRDHLQDSIDEEFKNVALRVTWMLAGQALMLSPMAAIATSAALSDGQRAWILAAICFSAAMVSLVLSLGAMLGHAYIEEMRSSRDEAEEELAKRFGVPATGIRIGSGLHRLKHSASRYLPLFFYCFWVCLLPLVMQLHVTPPVATCCSPCKDCPQPPPPSPGRTAWIHYGRSETFPRGEASYPDKPATGKAIGCPTLDIANEWIRQFVSAWERRREPSASDVIMLIGGSDSSPVPGSSRQEADPNQALARQRADEILRLLAMATAGLAPWHRIDDKRAIVLVTGPKASPALGKRLRERGCGEQDEFRTVQVWYQATGE